ncbi:hypothetical protein NP493_713g00015 [Ridgeia piscesae]|uniref:Uncharacterized protein n=1 Tax=Ridgeia piscesae TaxID=27915 RepID=A0AAD9KQU2_RIDPI|nr:hypothetical protein NP493_713g00015 [Ridgeia piscesae]
MGGQETNCERQTDGDTGCDTERQTHRDTGWNTERQTDGDTMWDTERQTDGDTMWDTERQTDGDTGCDTERQKQMETQGGTRRDKHMETQCGTQRDKHTETPVDITLFTRSLTSPPGLRVEFHGGMGRVISVQNGQVDCIRASGSEIARIKHTLDGNTGANGNHETDATGRSCEGTVDRRSLPIPPPPAGLHSCLHNPQRASTHVYTTHKQDTVVVKVLVCSTPPAGLHSCLHNPQTVPRSSACQSSGRGGKPGLYRNTVVTFSLVSLVVSVVYGACHHVDTQATVIITIPPQFPLDLDDASLTYNPPCSAKEACPDAYTQNLGGCDPAQGHCVCQRGYQLTDGLCTGEDTDRQLTVWWSGREKTQIDD